MTLSQQLAEYISACFTGLWVQSHEHEDALAEIAQLCRDENWRLAVWDIAQGLQIVVIEHELPGRDQLEDLARSLATEAGELPEGDQLGTVLDAASGLTRYEAEAAFSLSLGREGAIRPQAIWKLKAQMLKKSGLLTLHRGSESFADLGGLDALKSFCTRAMRRQGEANPLKRSCLFCETGAA